MASLTLPSFTDARRRTAAEPPVIEARPEAA